MREVEASSPGEQEFACGARGHVPDDDRVARESELLGRHQAGRPGADDHALSRFRPILSGQLFTSSRLRGFDSMPRGISAPRISCGRDVRAITAEAVLLNYCHFAVSGDASAFVPFGA